MTVPPEEAAAAAAAAADKLLVQRVTAYVEQYMSQYDGSHDYNHILRVLGLARRIASSAPRGTYDSTVVTLAALLHDVGDKKYLQPGQDSTTLVRTVLVDLGVSAELAERVQTIVTAVSYSAEIRDPGRVRDVIRRYPELAVVQDADRLDAIGAVGIGRTFTFGGAMYARTASPAPGKPGLAETSAQGRGMGETIEHFEDKLLKLEGMMKTDAGKMLARERTERLSTFRSWWDDEIHSAHEGLDMTAI